jgi:Secretion system C-terminal sorting domain/Outer membrane protein Omp28
MKKKLLPIVAITLLSFSFGNAQTQRTSLYEEWTGETCPPCAFYNPGITTLVESNQTPARKVILLRYQVAIPSAPTSPTSLYQQNPTEPTARQNFYVPAAGKFAPQGRLNGKAFGTGSNAGSVTLIDQTEIDNAYIVDAPFGMTLTHKLTAGLDSVKIKYSINAAQAFSTNNPLKLRMAICEHEIEYDVQPGSNGEKNFEWVMRKMVPNVTGTALAATWTAGQTLTDSFTVALPTYIWDKNEVSVVAFVQEDKPSPGPTITRDIHQSAYSPNQPLALDASAYGSNLEGVTCATTVNPRFIFRNTGATTLTSATIDYTLNGGTTQSLTWTGSLLAGDTTSIAIPTISGLAIGSSNSLVLKVKLPNGAVDNNTIKDSKTASFKVLPAASNAATLSQNFLTTTFPPTNWTVVNKTVPGWSRSAAGNAGIGSAKIDFYNIPAGGVNELLIENQDFTGASNSTITFDVASAPYSATSPEADELKVDVSDNCGTTWTTVYQKSGATLNTTAAVTAAFTPATANQWRAETVSLPAFTNPSNVIVKFVATSDYGNNTYVDNIQLNKVLSISKVAAIEINNLDVFPNPAKDNLQLKFTTVNPKPTEMKIFNALGKLVRTQQLDKLSVGLNKLTIDVKDLSTGVYSVQLNQNDFTVSKSFVVQQ